MLCDNCIKQLAVNLSRESRQIISVLNTDRMNKDQIGQKAKLTYAITQRAMKELEGSLFVAFQEEGRSKIFYLTESGLRLLDIYNKEKRR
jgi:predicted transcriptional regulator